MKTLLKSFILFSMYLFLLGCKVNETPTFENIQNVHILESTPKGIKLSADLSFLNPNLLGGKIQLKGIDILVNDQKLGNLLSDDFDVPAQNSFTVPLTCSIDYDDLSKNAEQNILGVLNTLVTKKLKIQYKGVATYKLALFSYDYPVDYTETVFLKK